MVPRITNTSYNIHSDHVLKYGFPAPLLEESVFSPLCILASFVKDKVSIGVWIYLWDFYFVPLRFLKCLMGLSLTDKAGTQGLAAYV